MVSLYLTVSLGFRPFHQNQKADRTPRLVFDVLQRRQAMTHAGDRDNQSIPSKPRVNHKPLVFTESQRTEASNEVIKFLIEHGFDKAVEDKPLVADGVFGTVAKKNLNNFLVKGPIKLTGELLMVLRRFNPSVLCNDFWGKEAERVILALQIAESTEPKPADGQKPTDGRLLSGELDEMFFQSFGWFANGLRSLTNSEIQETIEKLPPPEEEDLLLGQAKNHELRLVALVYRLHGQMRKLADEAVKNISLTALTDKDSAVSCYYWLKAQIDVFNAMLRVSLIENYGAIAGRAIIVESGQVVLPQQDADGNVVQIEPEPEDLLRLSIKTIKL